MIHGLEPTLVRGFRVYAVLPPEYDLRALLARLGEELDLIHQLAPGRMQRLRRIDPDLALVPLFSGGYLPWANAITLHPDVLTNGAPGYAAHVLVHESNHARVQELCGAVAHPWLEWRAERLATLDQALFACWLERAGYIAAVEQFLTGLQAMNAEGISIRSRKREARRQALERVGAPPWMFWMFGMRSRRTSNDAPTAANA